MARYIDADKAEERFKEIYCDDCDSHNGIKCRACGFRDGADVFSDAPTEDVQLVVHGGWVGDEDYEHLYGYYEAYKCSNCGRGVGYRSLYPYCPECGTKMENGVTEEERMRY